MRFRHAWVIVAVAVTVVAAALGLNAVSPGVGTGEPEVRPGRGQPPRPSVDERALAALPGDGRLIVRAVDPAAPREDGPLHELDDGTTRRAGRMRCKRVHMSADAGLCLALAPNGIDYDGIVFDDAYEPRRRFPIVGVPDRARVSPDGRYGAYTSFDPSGTQNYFASSTEFETYTRIVDMSSARELLRLERLELTRDGKRLSLDDPQFWGVTFGPGGRFYATVGAGRSHYLIAGRIGRKRARVVGDDVECPALSPDGTRIAYKRRIGDSNRWRLHVLELASGRDTPLAEPRSIDDQPEWAGPATILYSDDRAVFAVAADGAGSPRRIADHATSQTFVPDSE